MKGKWREKEKEKEGERQREERERKKKRGERREGESGTSGLSTTLHPTCLAKILF